MPYSKQIRSNSKIYLTSHVKLIDYLPIQDAIQYPYKYFGRCHSIVTNIIHLLKKQVMTNNIDIEENGLCFSGDCPVGPYI